MTQDSLIGSTGFVGTNLKRQFPFDHHYHSMNSDEMRGRSFGLVVCCGVSAMKWKANADPAADWTAISKLLNNLKQIEAREFVLISTVDVFGSPVLVDENSDPRDRPNSAYGAHRLQVEEFTKQHFEKLLILRLPGLFGMGLKKNVIYDLLHDNNVHLIHPEGSFQYYDLDNLWHDIQVAREAQLSLVHLATEPIATSVIAERFFPGKVLSGPRGLAARYDMRTIHAGKFGGSGGYIAHAPEVLRGLGRFLQTNGKMAVA
jgi:hypothetical protein